MFNELLSERRAAKPANQNLRILYIRTDLIRRNPSQPRVVFDDASLAELADSIARHGVIQPLTVRNVGGVYELVAGERRLRASRIAGLSKVPCVIAKADDEQSSVLSLIENMQRRDLDFLEEALGIKRLVGTFGMTQEAAAREIGRSQPAVANKLRVLGLPMSALVTLRDGGCTERHARALLRLGDALRCAAAEHVVAEGLNVAETERYVEKLLSECAVPRRAVPGRRQFVPKDVRIFLNTIRGAYEQMKGAGVDAVITEEEHDDDFIVTIRVPKAAKTIKTA